MPELIDNKIFDKATRLEKAEYENCRFINCDLSQANLSGYSFMDCSFEHCNLGMAVLKKTSLKGVAFKHCKLLGLNFSDCNIFLLAMDFEDCQLNLASFFGLKLKNRKFIRCSFLETDFTEADLGGCLFDDCNFDRALFRHTVLDKADLRSSRLYVIDPEHNKLKGAKFAFPAVLGLLDKYDIVVD